MKHSLERTILLIIGCSAGTFFLWGLVNGVRITRSQALIAFLFCGILLGFALDFRARRGGRDVDSEAKGLEPDLGDQPENIVAPNEPEEPDITPEIIKNCPNPFSGDAVEEDDSNPYGNEVFKDLEEEIPPENREP